MRRPRVFKRAGAGWFWQLPGRDPVPADSWAAAHHQLAAQVAIVRTVADRGRWDWLWLRQRGRAA